MSTTSTRSSIGHDLMQQEKDEPIDLEALTRMDHGVSTEYDTLSTPQQISWQPTLVHKLLRYPPQGNLNLRPTSWLDGVRGIAALEVYLFHTMGLWTTLYPAFHSTSSQNNPLQFPLIRTLFVSGPDGRPALLRHLGVRPHAAPTVLNPRPLH